MMKKIITLGLLLAAPPVLFSEDLPGNIKKVFESANLPLYRSSVKARNFSLSSLDGKIVNLYDFKGKVIFLNFWATWCGPCRAEMPSMQKLYERFSKDGLEMIAVNLMEKKEQAASFMKNNKLNFTTLLDSSGQVSGIYGVNSIPSTFIIDRNGNIITHSVGTRDWSGEKIIEAFDALLKQPFQF